jgi:hypothetical protein
MPSKRKQAAKKRKLQRDRGAQGRGTSKYAQKKARGGLMYG